MPDCAQKIITANTQPTDGRATIAVAGLKGDRGASATKYTLAPPVTKGEPVASIETRLDNRLDKVRYYSGDTSA